MMKPTWWLFFGWLVVEKCSGLQSRPRLFEWAVEQGGYVAESLHLSEATDAAPRALRVSADVAAGTVLCTLPSHLQLGAAELYASSDSDSGTRTLAADSATARACDSAMQ